MARKKQSNNRRKTTQRRALARRDSFDPSGPSFGWIRKAFKLVLILGLWGVLIVGCIVAWYAAELPKIVQSTQIERRIAVTIKAADDTVVARYGELKGNTIRAEDLPKNLIHAVIAVEDRRFYKHFGIDPFGLARAMVVNITRGGTIQGGSTITQQLAKNLFLTQERKLKRKIQEALLALWLEHQLTKDEIMTAYLNRVYLGSGAYGVEAAAQVYFSKSARDLNLQESATIAGLLKAPSKYSPIANPNASRKRMQVVLAAMVDAGYLSESQYAKIGKIPAVPKPKPTAGETERYYTDYIMSELVRLIGPPEDDMIVETTLWPQTQEAAETVVNRMLDTEGKTKGASQSAVVMMDVDGAVRVMVGGRNYAKSQFNRATQSLRQPGSTFKPIVYLTAIEAGWSPNDIIDDHPIAIGKYRPANFKNEYYGPVPLHFALSRSLNSAAIQLAQFVGTDSIAETASNLGIRAKLDRNLSLALGGSGVPVIEMTTAYASLASGGIGVDPYAIDRVLDKNGKVLYQRREKSVPLQVVRRDSVEKLASMMRETIDEGTGQRAQIPYLAAGKTGTTQDYRDAWFMGFSGPFAIGVWVGNDNNKPMKNVTGGTIPASIWKDVMLAAYNEAPARGMSTDSRISFYQPAPSSELPVIVNDGPYNPDAAYSPSRAQRQQQAAPARRQPQSFGELLSDIFSF